MTAIRPSEHWLELWRAHSSDRRRSVDDYSTDLEAQVDPDSRDVGSDLIESARATFLTLVASGTDPMVAKQVILELEPFYNHPDIVEALDE